MLYMKKLFDYLFVKTHVNCISCEYKTQYSESNDYFDLY